MQGLAEGREWAADALYDRVHPVVDQALRRILRSTGPDYDDLVQASFERIVRVLSNKPLNREYDLRAWSAAVTTHVAIDNLRRRAREWRLFETDTEVPGPRSVNLSNAEERLEARSEIGRVQFVLAKMKPAAAQTLLLHDVFGYDLSEVAELTGVSVAAAQSRLVRSRRELARRAQQRGGTT